MRTGFYKLDVAKKYSPGDVVWELQCNECGCSFYGWAGYKVEWRCPQCQEADTTDMVEWIKAVD